MFIDSHAHLSMLIHKRDIRSDLIITELKEKSVLSVLNISGNNEELQHALSLNKSFDSAQIKLFHAAGIHPHEAEKSSEDYTWIRKNSSEIVAIGEVGLDFHYNFSPAKEQEKILRNMIDLSIELKKPLIVHGRSAEKRAVDIIREYRNDLKVLFHCYTGDMKTALEIVEKGWLISFSGILTFKKSTDSHKILKAIGISKILFETDSPFLAPVPFRGKVNTPAKVFHVYDFASKLLGIDIDELAKAVSENFNDFFGLK